MLAYIFAGMGKNPCVSRLSCRESDLFVTRAKILIASEKLQGFVPNPARNLTAHKDRFLGRGEKCLERERDQCRDAATTGRGGGRGRSRGEKVWGAES